MLFRSVKVGENPGIVLEPYQPKAKTFEELEKSFGQRFREIELKASAIEAKPVSFENVGVTTVGRQDLMELSGLSSGGKPVKSFIAKREVSSVSIGKVGKAKLVVEVSSGLEKSFLASKNPEDYLLFSEVSGQSVSGKNLVKSKANVFVGKRIVRIPEFPELEAPNIRIPDLLNAGRKRGGKGVERASGLSVSVPKVLAGDRKLLQGYSVPVSDFVKEFEKKVSGIAGKKATGAFLKEEGFKGVETGVRAGLGTVQVQRVKTESSVKELVKVQSQEVSKAESKSLESVFEKTVGSQSVKVKQPVIQQPVVESVGVSVLGVGSESQSKTLKKLREVTGQSVSVGSGAGEVQSLRQSVVSGTVSGQVNLQGVGSALRQSVVQQQLRQVVQKTVQVQLRTSVVPTIITPEIPKPRVIPKPPKNKDDEELEVKVKRLKGFDVLLKRSQYSKKYDQLFGSDRKSVV